MESDGVYHQERLSLGALAILNPLGCHLGSGAHDMLDTVENPRSDYGYICDRWIYDADVCVCSDVEVLEYYPGGTVVEVGKAPLVCCTWACPPAAEALYNHDTQQPGYEVERSQLHPKVAPWIKDHRGPPVKVIDSLRIDYGDVIPSIVCLVKNASRGSRTLQNRCVVTRTFTPQ
jgi:hypothetical protein